LYIATSFFSQNKKTPGKQTNASREGRGREATTKKTQEINI
jgi:hypothetical protein